MNSEEKFQYWEDIAQYDLDTARAMFQSGRYLYVVFMCQQAVEKLSKGLYVLFTGEDPPRTHNIWLIINRIFQLKSYKDQISSNLTFKEKILESKPFFAELVAYYISERYQPIERSFRTQSKRRRLRKC